MEYEHISNTKYKYSARSKIIVTIGIAAFIATGFIIVRAYDPYRASERGAHLQCYLHALTGVYCPSCGISRMMFELTNLNFMNALRNNAFFMLLAIPLTVYTSLKYYLYFILEKNVLPGVEVKKWMIITAVVLMAVFTVLRNIPGEPFSLLAPFSY